MVREKYGVRLTAEQRNQRNSGTSSSIWFVRGKAQPG